MVALGKREVSVVRKPKLAILSVGDEIVDLDHFDPDRIVNNYAYVISAATLELGGIPILLGIAPDDPASIATKLSEGVQRADAVATIGGCSVGAKDFVPEAITKLGEVIVHGVKIRPGHVAGVGFVRGKPVFMLPGHISSCIMAFYVLAVPTLAKLAGTRPSKMLPTIRAELAVAVDRATTHTFLRLKLKERSGRVLAEPVHGGTNILSSLSRANGFAIVPPRTSMRKGQRVSVTLFSKLEHANFD
jgi:molybdenum cofactor synthesis domain-containing protein